jgi:arginine exporter protein ArgO
MSLAALSWLTPHCTFRNVDHIDSHAKQHQLYAFSVRAPTSLAASSCFFVLVAVLVMSIYAFIQSCADPLV